MLLKVFVLVVGALSLTTAVIDDDTKETIQDGLETGTEIIELLTSGGDGNALLQFTNSLRVLNKFADKLMPFLGAVGPLTSLVFMFLPSEDDAFQAEVRESFRQVNRKLDLVLDRLADVEDTVEWIVEKNDFYTFISKIGRCRNKLVELSNSNDPDEKKRQMLQEYNAGYLDSGERLKDMLIGTYTTSIIDLYKDYTNNHRRKVNQFMMQGLRYVIEASEVEMAFMELGGYSEQSIQDEMGHWQNYINAVQEKMRAVDETFHVNDAQTDIDEFLTEHGDTASRDLTKNLRDLLVDKFYWKKWLVFSYKSTVSEAIDGAPVAPWTFDYYHDGYDRTLKVSFTDLNRAFDVGRARTELTAYKDSRDPNDSEPTDWSWWCWNCGMYGGCCTYRDDKCDWYADDFDEPFVTVYDELPSVGQYYTFVIKECFDFWWAASSSSATWVGWIHRCHTGDCSTYHALVFG